MSATSATGDRRPIRSRSNSAVRRFAAWLARLGVSPNAISVAGIVFAAAGAASLVWLPAPFGLLLCALSILLRLLCNMFDGMVAVEEGRGTATGPLFNELPDRVADTLLLVALGHACGLDWLGWLTAVLALTTAYVRALGKGLGHGEDFRGPMAKPHRMWTMIGACLLAPLADAAQFGGSGRLELLRAALIVIAAGTAVTVLTRLTALRLRLSRAV